MSKFYNTFYYYSIFYINIIKCCKCDSGCKCNNKYGKNGDKDKDNKDKKSDKKKEEVEENKKYKKCKLDNDEKCDIDQIVEYVFSTLADKTIFFTEDSRNNPNFKHFEFIKNMYPNGDNRCWFISSLISLFNTPVIQEILLNNDFSDNEYLKLTQELLLDARLKNNEKKHLNCDKLLNSIDKKTNRNGGFSGLLIMNECFSTQRKDRIYGPCFYFENIFINTIMTNNNVVKNIDKEKMRSLDPFVYIIKKTVNFDISYGVPSETTNSLSYYYLPILGNKDPDGGENKCVGMNFMFFFDNKTTEDSFLTILKSYKNKKNPFTTIEEAYDFFSVRYNNIVKNFNFSCNAIIFCSPSYHFFSICKNNDDNNWYSFNSLDGDYGTICNDKIDEMLKNKILKVSGHDYLPNFFIITVSSK